MHELTKRANSHDPDKTNPPGRVEELWGGRPPRGETTCEENLDGAAIPLTGNDAMSLYWAARDCLDARAWSGASALLRRLILHLSEEKPPGEGTREEAERLLTFAELLLGRPPEPTGRPPRGL
jgi:hypothetical protein